jgi:hypothetical protein
VWQFLSPKLGVLHKYELKSPKIQWLQASRGGVVKTSQHSVFTLWSSVSEMPKVFNPLHSPRSIISSIFQPNPLRIFVTYIFYQIYSACFDVLYNIFRENFAYLLKTVSFLQGFYTKYVIYHMCSLTIFLQWLKQYIAHYYVS